MQKKGLFLRKAFHSKVEELGSEHHEFKRHLGGFHLTAIGIGAIIGAGIFVITGQAAATYAGPAIFISFIIAAIICLFAGLCYAELASLIPIGGGSYSYAYVALGEFPAWIVGVAITAQYLVSASTVAVGWSGYFVSLLRDFGLTVSPFFANAPFLYDPGTGWHWSGSFINLPAIFIVGLVGFCISVGISAVARFNNLMVIIKLSAILLFLLLGIPHITPSNWVPFIPENTGVFGQFGWSGILRASGLVFFAYLGFDTVSSLAQDAKNPQRDLPRGILGSLFICTAAYILTSLVLTGVVSYTKLGVADPMSVALNALGPTFFWLKFIVKIAIVAGLASVVLVQLLGQTRIFYSIGKDGLLPSAFCKVHPKLKTPLFSSIFTGIVSLVIAGLFPINILGELVSLTTLFLYAIVCFGVLVMRRRHPELKRPFKVPLVPLIPILGILTCVGQMCFLDLV
ncbi:MAG: amino acid permease, partial [Chlamydiia bacterium]|nr:amino acid permease [Chlamydiia bacterium]